MNELFSQLFGSTLKNRRNHDMDISSRTIRVQDAEGHELLILSKHLLYYILNCMVYDTIKANVHVLVNFFLWQKSNGQNLVFMWETLFLPFHLVQ